MALLLAAANALDASMLATPKATYLKDYQPPAFMVDKVGLTFKLFDDYALVENTMSLTRNGEGAAPIVLDGEELELVSIIMNGDALGPDSYTVTDHDITLPACDGTVELTITTRIKPQENTRLEGLYRSSGNFCTQCEAEGFRRITYYPDRPDVLAPFVTRIEADLESCPVLLGNGNPVEQGNAGPGRHYAVWDDPHPKPCYLFALVAGHLVEVRDSFTTQSGRAVQLGIFVEPGNEDKTGHAMASLKASMRWDETAYGREYDLDVFNIVAVGDFNMGAMENKGLNIFNTKYVLASEDTATDGDYEGVESVIAHEYFHNWSGNRVTCRDWFQLTLKEGFTVFRDQQFSADMNDAAVKRIADVQALRAAQFPEDAGPLAHPIQPKSYIEINNFYTATVYEKGAEVIRMMHGLVGPQAFRQGTDLYFERYDGQAVTCEDFITSIEEASGHDLGQFRRWYDQAGTPVILAKGSYDEASHSYTLELTQQLADTPGQSDKKPMVVPVRMGLVAGNGQDLPLYLDGEDNTAVGYGDTTRVIELTDTTQSFRFVDVSVPPTPSLFRGFSAPVTLKLETGNDQLVTLGSHDSDPFNRWEAGQTLTTRLIMDAYDRQHDTLAENGSTPKLIASLFRANLDAPDTPDRFRAKLLSLPPESYLAQQCENVNPLRLHNLRDSLYQGLAESFEGKWQALYDRLSLNANPAPVAEQIGRRSLRNTALGYLCQLPDDHGISLANRQYQTADNMTDRLAALSELVDAGGIEADTALNDFYQRWRHEDLVIDKWFMIQARSCHPDTLSKVRSLMEHPAFTLKNPNRLRSLVGAFAAGNPQHFHAPDGSGYKLLIDVVIELNSLNPQTAARLLAPMRQWRRYEPIRQAAMAAELKRLLDQPKLSPEVYEVASKSLDG